MIKERAFESSNLTSHRHDFNRLELQNFMLPVPSSCDQMCNKQQHCYHKEADKSECF